MCKKNSFIKKCLCVLHFVRSHSKCYWVINQDVTSCVSFLPLCYCLNGLLIGSWSAGARFQQVSLVERLVITISVQLFRKTIYCEIHAASHPTKSASQCVPHKTTVVLASDASLSPCTAVNYRRLTAEIAAFIRIRRFILAHKSVLHFQEQ